MGESLPNAKLNSALAWCRMGVAPIPIRAGTKAAAVSWRVYQSRLPAVADVRRWFALGTRYELAVVCGGRAGLVVLDFDTRDAFASWRAGCDIQTYTVQTPRGYHVYLFAPDARSFDVPGVEVRGPGRYCLCPPSLHPSGAAYRVFDGLPVASVARLADVLPAEPVRAVHHTHIPGILPTTFPVTSPIAALKLKLSLLQVVRDVVELRSSDGGVGRWFVGLCPFHGDAHPSLWLDAERGRFGCHSPACRAHRSGDVLDFLALLRDVPVRELLAGGVR